MFREAVQCPLLYLPPFINHHGRFLVATADVITTRLRNTGRLESAIETASTIERLILRQRGIDFLPVTRSQSSVGSSDESSSRD